MKKLKLIYFNLLLMINLLNSINRVNIIFKRNILIIIFEIKLIMLKNNIKTRYKIKFNIIRIFNKAFIF